MLFQLKSLARMKDRRYIRNLSVTNVGKRLRDTAIVLGGLFGLHTGAMMAFEGMALIDAVWLTAMTFSTVGYGDISAATVLGKASTIVLGVAGGITALAQSASLYLDHKHAKRQNALTGKRSWNMDKHIVILNGPKNKPENFFKHLVSEYRKSKQQDSNSPIIIVNNDFEGELPSELVDMNAAFVNESPTTPESFERADLKDASTILILARESGDLASDSTTFDLVCRAREENPNAHIVAECVNPAYKARLKKAGANGIVRPMRNYPELLVSAILSPGSEVVVEDILDADGEESVTYNVDFEGKWADVATKIIVSDIGTPLAYITKDGEVVSNANPNDAIEGKAVVVLAREGNLKTASEVAALLKKAAPKPPPAINASAPEGNGFKWRSLLGPFGGNAAKTPKGETVKAAEPSKAAPTSSAPNGNI